MAHNEKEKPQTPASEDEYQSNAARRIHALEDKEGQASDEGGEAVVKGSFFANFWYHHKWKVIIGAVFAFILATGISQCATHANPDVSIIYAGPDYITPNGNRAFCAVLEGMMEDYNGDGRTYAQLNDMVYYTDEQLAEHEKFCAENDIDDVVDHYANAQAGQRFTYQIFGGDSLICVLSPGQYQMVADSEGFMKLSELFEEIPEGAVDAYGVRFAETKLWKFYDAVRIFPDDVIIAIRSLPTISSVTGRKKAEEAQVYNMELFKTMLTFEYPEGYVEPEQ